MAQNRLTGAGPDPLISSSGIAGLDPGESSLVGRRAVLTAVNEMMATMQTGEGHSILLDGEAGIGKSRVVRESLATARARSFSASSAECLIEPFNDGPVVPHAASGAPVRLR